MWKVRCAVEERRVCDDGACEIYIPQPPLLCALTIAVFTIAAKAIVRRASIAAEFVQVNVNAASVGEGGHDWLRLT